MAKGSRKDDTAKIASMADAAALRALRRRVAVLPVGAIEQHGAHLPVSTDADIATEISRRLCQISGYALLPTFSYGSSFEHAPRLNMSLRGPTLRAAVRDIAASAADAGAATLIVLNAHHGNRAHLARLPARVRGHSGGRTVRCIVVHYWHLMDAEMGHAGHTETSIMLALGSADMARARRGYVEPASMTARQRAAAARLSSRSFLAVAKNGVWGDPRGATRRIGESLLAEIAGNVADECARLLRASPRTRKRQKR